MSNVWQAALMILVMAATAMTAGGQQPKSKDSGEQKASAAKQAEAKPKKHKVTAGRFRIDVELKGVLEARRMAEVKLKPNVWTTFQVTRAVPHGQRVKKGQPIVWFDTTKLDEEIENTQRKIELGQLTLAQTQAELKLLEQSRPLDLQAAQRSKQIADEELDYFLRVGRPQSEKWARFSLDQARYQLEYAEEELKQLEKMYEADDLTEETEEIILKRARRDVEAFKFFLERTKLSTERTLKTTLPRQQASLIQSAKREAIDLARAKTVEAISLKKKQLEMESQRREQKKAAERLAKLKRDRQLMVLRSPINGYVYYGRCQRGKWVDKTKTDAQLRPGGSVSPHQVLLTIVAPDQLTVRVDLAEKHLADVRRGVRGTATPTGFADVALPVRVERVDPVPVSQGTFDCRLRLDNAKTHVPLMPGMTCTVKLTVYDKKNAITVPAKAVFSEEDDPQQHYVYVVAPEGKPRKTPVTVGKRTEEKVEIVKGLRAGTEILLSKPENEQ